MRCHLNLLEIPYPCQVMWSTRKLRKDLFFPLDQITQPFSLRSLSLFLLSWSETLNCLLRLSLLLESSLRKSLNFTPAYKERCCLSKDDIGFYSPHPHLNKWIYRLWSLIFFLFGIHWVSSLCVRESNNTFFRTKHKAIWRMIPLSIHRII